MNNHRPTSRRGAAILGAIVLIVTTACIVAIAGLLLRSNADPGLRVWLLNHQPDQAIIVNPFNGQVEQKFLVADGLRELTFSRDHERAYVASVVDVANRIKVLNTRSYLQEDNIAVDGIPQAIAVFPDDSKLAVILGSKTDFMAGGFDVIDLNERSTVDAHRRKRLYRERELSLTHKLAVGDDGDRIYVIDAKQPLVNVYSLKAQSRVARINVQGSPEELCYPTVGDFYYVSVLDHLAVYQLDKQTDQIVAAYVPEIPDPFAQFHFNKVKFPAVDKTGDYLFATSYQSQQVYIWEVGNPDRKVNWGVEAAKYPEAEELAKQGQLPFMLNKSYDVTQDHYLPLTSFKLKPGYRPDLSYAPEPTRIAIDSMNQNVFVVDSNGALFVYDFNDTLRAKPGEVIEPYKIVHGLEGEMRDLKVSRPAVRQGKRGATSESEGADPRPAGESPATPGA